MMKFLVTVSQSSKPLSYTTLALTSALTQLLFSMSFQDWQCDIQNNQGQGNRDLDYVGYHKNRIQ